MTSRRLFLAVDLPASAKEACRRLTLDLKQTGADVKWVDRENFHVTLRFLGDVAEDRIQKVTDACEATTKDQRAFFFSLDVLGAFPSAAAPRIVWVGVRTDEDPFGRLAGELETALSHLGFKKEERAFHPHVTIGRVRSARNRVHLIEALLEKKETFSLPGLSARTVTLFESILTPHGALYAARAILPLVA